MRLIDADALIAQWESDAEEMEELAIKLATYGAINDVKHQPTIEPRKIAHWNHNGFEWKATCSECGEPCATYSMGKPRDRFCKWCGARMTEGEADG